MATWASADSLRARALPFFSTRCSKDDKLFSVSGQVSIVWLKTSPVLALFPFILARHVLVLL